MDDAARREVRDLVLDDGAFGRLTVTRDRRGGGQGAPGGQDEGWHRAVVRPVEVRGRRHLQFSYFDATRDVTRNVAGPAARRELDTLLATPARAVTVRS